MSERLPVRVLRVSDEAEANETSRDVLTRVRRRAGQHCGWCGRILEQGTNVGRRRRYCGQSCRQRAYERRTAVQRTGLPEDAVVLSDSRTEQGTKAAFGGPYLADCLYAKTEFVKANPNTAQAGVTATGFR